MAKEFFWPGRIHLTVPGGVDGVDGGIIYPIGVLFPSLMRRDIDKMYPHLTRRLLDPQLYLVGLDPYTCRKKCAYLASYPWFPTNSFPAFKSGECTQADWQKEMTKNVHKLWKGQLPKEKTEIIKILKNCLSVQETLNCENFILPSPLTVDQTTDYSTELKWLDLGLKVSEQINDATQTLATIAISDHALRLINPWENDLIDLIIDQVSSREPDGAYIVLEQAHEKGYYCTHHHTFGCLLRLVHGLKAAGLKRVVVAYSGIAGFASLLAGADIWSSGWYKAERKLKLADIEDRDGRAYPTYYSHDFASEFNLDKDLDCANKKGLLANIQEMTPASAPLLAALKSGKKVSNVAEWKYGPSHVTAAKEHFVSVAINRTSEIATMSKDELYAYGLSWLENAENLAEEVSTLGNCHERTEINHQSSWLRVFKEFVGKVS